MCRVGMTTDLQARRSAWRAQYPNLRNWQILASGLTYDEALRVERLEAERRGCESSGGGPRNNQSNWSVYYFEY